MEWKGLLQPGRVNAMKRFTADNFTGCLVGGAIGDALGYFVEFDSAEEIFQKYGEDGLSDFSQEDRDVYISDDTQMTLFTANGLLYYASLGAAAGDTAVSCLYEAYVDWLRTQQRESADTVSVPEVRSISWILNLEELHHRRGPGNTCLSALGSGAAGTTEDPINNSKGCGGIMRSAPIGLFVESPVQAARLAAEASALTHGHPLGFIPSAAYAFLINRLVYSEDSFEDILSACADMLIKEYGQYPETLRVLELLTKAVSLALEERASEYSAPSRSGIAAVRAGGDPVYLAPPRKKYSQVDMKKEAAQLEKIGAGWVAEETLAIAVYCCLRYGDDFETAVRVAANHSGDSDSTASLVGALIGAVIGNSNMPTKYVMLLELYDVISEIAQDLYDGCSASATVTRADDSEWLDKYVYHSYR